MMGRLLRAFAAREDGIIAVEFAFVAPIMVMLFFGLAELTRALIARADVINLASTGANLIAEESKVTGADITNVFGALNAILYPYDPTKAQVTIYSILSNGSAQGTVDWSCQTVLNNGQITGTTGPTAPPAGSQGGAMVDSAGGGSVILVTVAYSYTSPTTLYLTGPLNWTSSFYARPRRVSQIPKPDSCS